MASRLSGVLTAMATPFDASGDVDYEAAAKLAVHLLDNGSDGLVVAGTTGEAATLSDEEQIDLLRAVRAEVGPEALLICGSGTNDTRHSIALTKAADDAGADAMLVVTPYYNKPNPAGIRAHVEAVAGATAKPIVIYNIPSRTVVNMPPELLAELAGIANVVAVKQANDAELQAITGLDVLAGNDGVFLRALEIGGTGGITVASHLVGPQMAAIRDRFEAGDLDGAREIDASLQPIYDALGVTTNPMPLKAALQMVGICSERMRLPMVPLDEGQREIVRSALETVGLEVLA
ncbi:MAG TPA: 4-hydroxy-tetrahydrodipicolinate synthase [Solirubrobacterales bacterium]|nr:4-hydroxy-tetrahydrodipicolinate synthase [Solirubrobacterales bacterium]